MSEDDSSGPGLPIGDPNPADVIITPVLELLGRRGTLLIIWALRGGRLTIPQLRRRCDGMLAGVTAQRIKELRQAGVLEPEDLGQGVALSDEGTTLLEAYPTFQAWAKRCAGLVAEPARPAMDSGDENRPVAAMTYGRARPHLPPTLGW
jgi:DNA-binding HxlR family transcriptional regulator